MMIILTRTYLTSNWNQSVNTPMSYTANLKKILKIFLLLLKIQISKAVLTSTHNLRLR